MLFSPENTLSFSWAQPGNNVDYWNTDISKNMTWIFVVYYGRMIANTENRVEVLNGQYFNVTVDRDDGFDIFYSKISSQSNGAEGNATNVTCIVPPLRFRKYSIVFLLFFFFSQFREKRSSFNKLFLDASLNFEIISKQFQI